MGQIMLFFLGSLVIAGLSWRVFSDVQSAGFFRFVVLEAIWALLIINVPWWFDDPLSITQIISWVLLAGCLALATSAGVLLLRARRAPRMKGTPSHAATSQALILVRNGPYRYIRHPLYASLMLFVWGTALKSGSLVSILFSLLATGFLYLTSLREEDDNLERFGEEYAQYMTDTRMFLPGVI